MNEACRALAALLSYPEAELVAALDEIRPLVPSEAWPLVDELATRELLSLQERYVELFDRSRALSLHLFEHVHGESRERGQAMVDLQAMYESRGYGVLPGELPDFIPAFLEFVSLAGEEEGVRLLRETAHILRALGERLARRGSRYAGVFAAVLALAGEERLADTAAEAPPEEALDEQWREPQVSFGGREAEPIRFYRKGVGA
ncbi:MAG TPA: nitrate reductase molybdenum cofactor assembly chaperone [Burkholderiales bacterium]|nr:nitrate reductase molybdenum cofactor assembly chaperone [Burkholderiales bacterium]